MVKNKQRVVFCNSDDEEYCGGGSWFLAPPVTMSCLNWNCRGLKNLQADEELAALVSNKDPMLVLLMETKVENFVFERMAGKFNILIYLLSHVIIPVVVLLYFGKLILMWMCSLFLIVILMLLLTIELVTLGYSRVAMVTLISPAQKTPSPCLELSIIGLICLGCV